MVQQLFHIFIVSAICMAWGIPVLVFCHSSVKKDEFWYHSFAGLLCFLFFSGCIFISIVSAWLYLFAPLKFHYLGLLTIVLLLYLFIFQRRKIADLFAEVNHVTSLSPLPVLFLLVSVFLFILLSALLPVNGDTQIYHLQIIQWETRYKVVPGIANLYPRFGLGSNWFNLISLFYWPAFKNENFTYLNAAFVSWFFIWLLSKWHFYSQKQEKVNFQAIAAFYFLLLIYCMFDWQLYRDSANSTNYDFAVNAFTIIICSFFIEAILTGKSRSQFSLIALLFVLCAISFKLSGIFLLLFVFYHVFRSWRTVKWGLSIATGVVILLPVILKNYVTSGYPLFPSPFGISTADWALPKQLASGLYRYIILSNRFYNYQWTFINTVDSTNFNWIPYWMNGILWKHKIIIALALLSLLFLFKKPDLSLNYKALRSTVVILSLMIIGWFFTAPDPGRFGYGILISTAFLTVTLVVHPLFTARISQFVLLATIIVTGIYTVKKAKPLLNDPIYIVHPKSFEDPSYGIIELDNINLKLPDRINGNWDCRCYFLPVPCITQKNPYLQARGKNLQDGFRMYPQPDSSFVINYLY